MGKKISSVMLCAVLFLASVIIYFPDSVSTIASGQTSDIGGTVIENGTFSYLSSYLRGEGRDATAYYTYKDSYFEGDSREYNGDLALMSLCMAMSAFGSSGSDDKANNIKELFDGIGFDYKKNNGEETVYYPSPEKDSIGFAIGRKTVYLGKSKEKCTLIAVAIRGAGYGKEWAGNFTLGSENEHSGFASAARKVYAAISGYLSENGMTGRIKLWITGYSRAAAVANITGAYLNGDPLSGIDQKDIYVYCFSCPNTTKSVQMSDNGNIFSIVNDNDIVGKVPLSAWGYTRYGKTYYFPSVKNSGDFFEKKKVMLAGYKELLLESGINKDVFYYESEEIYGYRSDGMLDAAGSSFGADAYVETLQKTVSGIISKVISILSGGRSSGDRLKAFGSLLPDILSSDLGSLRVKMGENGLEFIIGGSTLTVPYIYAGSNIAGKLVSGKSEMSLLDLILSLSTASDVLNYFSYHYPELCLAWMRSYGNEIEEINTRDIGAKYMHITVEGFADASVYDRSGALCASVIKEKASETEHGIAVFADGSGRKTFILPSGQEYRADFAVYGGGTLTCIIKEIEGGTETVRCVCFDGIALSAGDSLTCIISSDDANDVLVRSGTREMTPNHVRSGAGNSKVDVTVTSSEGGNAFGKGIFDAGTSVYLYASEDDGYDFKGWYDGGELVSGDKIYRLLATDDISLNAVFEAEKTEAGPSVTAVMTESISETQKTAAEPPVTAAMTESIIETQKTAAAASTSAAGTESGDERNGSAKYIIIPVIVFIFFIVLLIAVLPAVKRRKKGEK